MESNTNSNTDIFEEVATDLYFGQAAANIQSDFVKFSITGANDCKFISTENGNPYVNPNLISSRKTFKPENHIIPHIKGNLRQKRGDAYINSLDIDLFAVGNTCDTMDNTKIVNRISRVHSTTYTPTEQWDWTVDKSVAGVILCWATVPLKNLLDTPKENPASEVGAFLTDRFTVISEETLALRQHTAMSFTVGPNDLKVGVCVKDFATNVTPEQQFSGKTEDEVRFFLSGSETSIRFVFEMAEPKIIPVTRSFLAESGDIFNFEPETFYQTVDGVPGEIRHIAPTTYSITAPGTPGSLVYRDSLNHIVQATASSAEQLQSNFDQIVFSAAVPGNEDCSGVIQKEIDELAFSGGGTLVLGNGTFTLHSTVTLPSKVTLTSKNKSVLKKRRAAADDPFTPALLMDDASAVKNLCFDLEDVKAEKTTLDNFKSDYTYENFSGIKVGVPNREAFHGFVIENCDFYTKSPEPFELKGENSGIFYAAAGIQITKHGKRLERTVVENVYGTNLRFWNLKHAIWAETIHITTDEPVQGDNKEYIGYIAGLAFDKLYINNCYIGIRCNTNNASFDEYLIQTKVGMKYGFYGVASLTNGYIYDLYDGENNPGHPAVGAVYTGVIDNKVGTYHTGHQTKNVVIDDGVVRGRRLYDHGWIDDLPNETYNSLRFSDNEFKKMPWYKYYGIRDNQLAFFLKKGGTMRVNGVDYLTGHNNADSAFDPFLRKLENRSFKLKLDNKKTAADPNVIELEFGEQNCSLIGFQTEAPCKFVKIEYRIKNPNYGKPVTGNEEPPPEFLWKELFSDQENRETTIGVPLNSSGTAKVVGIRYSFAEAQYQGDDIVDQADNLYINHLFMFQHDHLPEMCLAVGGGKLYGGLDLNGLFLNKANVAVPETLSGFNQLPLLDKDGVPHLATEEISSLSTIPEAAVFYLLGDTPPKSPCSMLQLFIKSENTVIQEFTGTVDTVYQSARRTGQLTKHEEYNQNKELVRRYYTLVWSAWTEQNSVKVLEEKKVDRANSAGGFEGGSGASAETTSNGVTSKTGGAAIGSEARAGYGGAAGFRAKANSGGAVGDNTLAYDGFSGGQGAKAASGVNAVQLGAGTNSEANSLQVYGYQLMDGQGHVPDARIPKLATGKVIETKTVNNFNSIPSSSSTGYFNYELSDGYESATVINNAVDFNAPDTIAQHMLLDGKLYYRKKNGFSSNSKWYSAYAGDSIELLSYTYSSETLSMSRSKCYLVDFTGSQNTLSLGYDDGPGIYHIFVTLHGDEFGIWSPNCRWQNGIAPDYVAETTYELTFVYDGTNAFGSFKVYPAL